MGYRVGGQCFATSEEASDYQMSMVVPTITADGSLKMPVYQNKQWYYGSQKIALTHPYCDPIQPLKDGIEVGIYLSALFAIAFIIKLIISIINSAQTQQNTQD
ncbi:hypothetical protein [Kingella oralis]|uniref:Uncharacterized protein n=1 Tax=Kingella oralis ATCC 51147 TaxID=629741 RepID=C4GI37_9NEIS|nr:hypothetical protein [Kingella oralis]EEP68625.1 hypothetical protein GCWU000324_00528 [Kingella oralis ATCC 51147]QMT42106.1 hypothetical protein H3L93_08790 [Kingella oralis]